jgi:CIC family chloride channel protein
MSRTRHPREPEDGDSHDRPIVATAPLGPVPAPEASEGGLAALGLVSLVAGAATGLVCAVFRLLLARAEQWRGDFISWAHAESALGFIYVAAACALAAGIAAWLVKRYAPEASGSGIPHVEAVLRGTDDPAPLRLIPVKFFGGLLAIGSGLALGREGPSVQMGAKISYALGEVFGRSRADCRMLLVAGAGAGLATAFNAPIAGAVFVLEELLRRFDTRATIATFGASAAAIGVARVLLGSSPDFRIPTISHVRWESIPLFVLFGLAVGLLGVAYSRTILRALGTMGRFTNLPVEVRAALIGAAVGLLAWFNPSWVGGGDALTQSTLLGELGGSMLIVLFLVRFGLGAVSYTAATPGGLFAPMLVLGSQAGVLFGGVCHLLLPSVAPDQIIFAVTGMAAFFAAVVGAPVTGMILAIELTGSIAPMLPMLAACFTAMLVTGLLRNDPIYHALAERGGGTASRREAGEDRV